MECCIETKRRVPRAKYCGQCGLLIPSRSRNTILDALQKQVDKASIMAGAAETPFDMMEYEIQRLKDAHAQMHDAIVSRWQRLSGEERNKAVERLSEMREQVNRHLARASKIRRDYLQLSVRKRDAVRDALLT